MAESKPNTYDAPALPRADAEDARVDALRQLGLLDAPAEERFDRIVRIAARLFEVPTAAINLIDRNRQHTLSAAGPPMADLPREDSFCAIAVGEQAPLAVEDARLDPRFVDNPLVVPDPGLRYYHGVPVRGPRGHVVGTLCVFDEEPREIGPGDEALLRELAGMVEDELADDADRDRAAAVQRGLFPKRRRLVDGWDLAGSCIVSREVGGDLYDWRVDPDGNIRIVVADVMGKGMAAALVMATLRAVMRATAMQGRPEQAMPLTAQALADDFGDEAGFATVVDVLVDTDSGRTEHVDAGHGLLWQIGSDGTTRRATVGGPPLGPFPDAEWPSEHWDLEPGDQLVLASDGLLDLFEDLAATEAAVAATRTAVDAEAAVDALLRDARSRRPTDDVTVVVLRRTT